MSLGSFDDGNSDKARQFLLDGRCERNHPKRHRTIKEAKGIAEKKRQRVKHNNAMRQSAVTKYKATVRRYWLGLADHPGEFCP